METKYFNFFMEIPNEVYEVMSVLQDINGTIIKLNGTSHSILIEFGCIGCICITDEGNRIKSYNEILDIQSYRNKNFCGNPIFKVEGVYEFSKWLKNESCGFSENLNHYAIITVNHFIDIASPFDPKINIKEL